MTGATTASAGTTLEMLELDRGYYRTSSTSQDLLECHQKQACVGGSNAEQYCASGYRDACKTPAFAHNLGLVTNTMMAQVTVPTQRSMGEF